VNVLSKAENLMNPGSMPYAMTASTQNQNNHNRTGLLYLEAAYKAGYLQLAQKVKAALVKDLKEQQAYYQYLRENKEDYYYQLASDERDVQEFLQIINQFEQEYEGKKPPVQELPQGTRAADSTQK
jgi:murein L,D-transpeptidase YcbB/YkuD